MSATIDATEVNNVIESSYPITYPSYTESESVTDGEEYVFYESTIPLPDDKEQMAKLNVERDNIAAQIENIYAANVNFYFNKTATTYGFFSAYGGVSGGVSYGSLSGSGNLKSSGASVVEIRESDLYVKLYARLNPTLKQYIYSIMGGSREQSDKMVVISNHGKIATVPRSSNGMPKQGISDEPGRAFQESLVRECERVVVAVLQQNYDVEMSADTEDKIIETQKRADAKKRDIEVAILNLPAKRQGDMSPAELKTMREREHDISKKLQQYNRSGAVTNFKTIYKYLQRRGFNDEAISNIIMGRNPMFKLNMLNVTGLKSNPYIRLAVKYRLPMVI